MSMPAPLSPLFTDLYEITMAAGYYASGIVEEATFSVFVRGSTARGYYVSAGIADVIADLASFGFSGSDIRYLEDTERFSNAFLSFLSTVAFTGSVMAVPEGTLVFPDEPIMEITAPVIEAQLLETRVLNTLGLASLIATKAARCVQAADDRPCVDFSLRRTHGVDAGMTVARSAYLAGFAGTSNVLAGKRWGIPVSGTMAHSFVTAFPSELEAFLAYADAFPDSTVLLIDTYDVTEGARNAVRTAAELRARGKSLVGVRLDSGDLAPQSIAVRRILDEAGFPEVNIYASNGLDEFAIADLLAAGAPIDAFGVGTRMGVSADRPYLDIVYKLVRLGSRDVRKLSDGKKTLAGMKQVFRFFDAEGMMREDIIGCRDETADGAFPLLTPVMENGRPAAGPEDMHTIRARVAKGLSRLPAGVRSLRHPSRYPVSLSERLQLKQT